MFCIVAFVVLAILGIFSASNRALAREAFDCVGRRVTLRPCNTGFDEKMKARILGVVITRSEGAAMFLNRYFELLAWAFFILMLASTIWSARGIYLFYSTGSCNGLNSSAFCVFDPSGNNNEVTANQKCTAKPADGKVTLKNVDTSPFPVMNASAPEKIVMIGSYHCDYTRATYPVIRKLAEEYNASLIFMDFPAKEKDDYFSRLSYAVYQLAPEKYWQFNDQMFSGEKSRLNDPAYINQILTGLGLDPKAVDFVVTDPQTETAVANLLDEANKTGFPGTPTVFINGTGFIGPKPYRVYAIALRGLLYWLI